MEDNIIKDSTDRISQVPEFIIHHIMSFLDSPKDRVRMSVLSKTWFSFTASFPILNFDICKFKSFGNGNFRDMFFKYVEYTTSRFCHQNITSAHTIILNTNLEVSTELDIARRCLELIPMTGVQVLVIDIWNDISSNEPKYRVANQLLSASSLTTLHICGCELPSSLMVDPVKFNYLKLLSLKNLHLDDQVFKNLTSKCPLLEEITVQYCHGFKRFCVSGLQNLQKVVIVCGVEIIDIEAPNLRDVTVIGNGRLEAHNMNLASCKKLTTLLYYTFTPSKSEVFSDFLSNFPFIQNLNLCLPSNCKTLKLSSSSLRKLVLTDKKSTLEEIDISTPNLLLFEYHVNMNLPALVVRESLQPTAQIAIYSHCCVNSHWFQKLKQILDKKNGFKVLKLQICADFFDVVKLKVIQSPHYKLKHVELKVTNIRGLSDYEAIVDAVLWCCCPRSLNLTSSSPTIDSAERIRVVKYTYERLLLQEDKGQIDIRIVLSSSSKVEKHFNDLNSFLTAWPDIGQYHEITFIKEEAVQEEAG